MAVRRYTPLIHTTTQTLCEMTDFILLDPPKLAEHFLKMCPEFSGVWNAHLEYWGDDERGEYIDIAEFARFLVDSYAEGRTERFPEIFAEIECLLLEGNTRVREIVAIGLLEDLQTNASHRIFGPEAFERWLGARSHEDWIAIAKAWEGKESLMDVVRDEIRRGKNT